MHTLCGTLHVSDCFNLFLETNEVTYFISLPKTNKATGTEIERVRDHSTDRSMRMMYYYAKNHLILIQFFWGDERNT